MSGEFSDLIDKSSLYRAVISVYGQAKGTANQVIEEERGSDEDQAGLFSAEFLLLLLLKLTS